ncbi:hypothetical protein PFISCL1PPCAC_16358 [Pristionchus fissidentatus]|uniref:Zinc finger protein n=1 Tax=Pristionchus fissidentatus TaxID=1538716 RepID=A0AAV5VZQ9_9BILA|nr:hypothetical protein PFISCL1PPCAC_16358 [Pristionchus fissidentatus]
MILPSCNEGNSLNPISFTDGHGAVILERLRYQRETGRFCDATLRVGTLNFSAHRNVLAACSPYFDSILKKNFVGKEVVNITCKNTAVFNLLLNYMYTGIVCIDRSSVSDLLTLANNLLITKLKNYCAEYLDRNIDSANCLAIKKLAKKYNLPTVYKTAAEYFDCNINRCLLDTVDLLSYKLVQLQLILNDPRFRDVISADVHLRLATRWASEDIEARFKDFRVLLYTCQMRKVSRQTIDYVMDYAPSMKEPRARLAVLNLINESGADLGKYEVEFHSLMAEVGHTLNISLHSREEGNNEEYDVYMEDEPPVEGERTAREILASDQRAYSISSQEDQPGAGVKLKLKLGGERKEGKRMERKKKKRVTDHGEPGTSAECTIDEDGIDGVYCVSEEAVLYPDADGLDPASVGEDDESENVMGGQAMCVHCRYAADETEDLHRHMALRHDSNTVLVCTLCDEGFEARWSKPFYEHVTAHFPSTDSITCEQCEYSTQEGLQAFLNHRIMHHPNERPFKCLTCGWRCATRTQLWSHERVHTGSASCSCQLCGRAFKRPEALETHKAHHNDRRTHSCVDCGWMSKTESELTSHRAVRHQLDVYTCHITGCDYVSTKKSQLAAHLRTHLAVRAHLCRICGRGFIEKSHVVRHERIHLTEKPFKCESCDYASSRRDKLKEHILKYHNGPTIGTTSAGGKQVQRRRYKRAKELAQAIANHSQSRTVDASLIFRPIESSRDRIEQWHQGLNQAHNHQLQAPRALSVLAPSMQHSSHLPMAPASPGSLSLMNAPLGGGIEDSPMMNPFNGMMGGAGDKDMEMVGLRLHESPLITPVPRSPHNHSDPFAMGNQDESHRPMSLPPYGGQHNWYT